MPTQTFPARYFAIREIESFILAEAQKVGFSSKELYAIELSVDEAVANIIDHSYCMECNLIIEVTAEAAQDNLRLIFKDNGQPFNPQEVPEPQLSQSPEERPEHGLGIFTMRRLMDEVTFDFSEPGVNKLTMVKYKRANS